MIQHIHYKQTLAIRGSHLIRPCLIMETIDVQNRSFVVRWLKCTKGDAITYQLKPLKKSIDVGIYKKHKSAVDPHNISVHIAADTKALLDYTNKSLKNRNNSISSSELPSPTTLGIKSSPTTGHTSPHSNLRYSYSVDAISPNQNEASRKKDKKLHTSLSISDIQQQTMTIPLKERLITSGFSLVQRLGTISRSKMLSGTLEVDDDDYYYAFVLDNTSSKSAKKRVLFKATVSNDEAQSIMSSKSIPSSVKTSQDSSNKDMLFRVGQGRYLQGFLLKKRRKRLQGFKKRFFTLDFKYGTLSYYLNEYNRTCRGEILINLSSVSANKKDRIIIIDSGMEVWFLKAQNSSSWKAWVDALSWCFNNDITTIPASENLPNGENTIISNREIDHSETKENAVGDDFVTVRSTTRKSLNHEDSTYPMLTDKAYFDFTEKLKFIQQKVEQCKIGTLNYRPNKQSAFGNDGSLIRESKQMKHFLGVLASGTVSIDNITTDKCDTDYIEEEEEDEEEDDGSPLEGIFPPKADQPHELYSRLSELEEIVSSVVQESRMLLDDYRKTLRIAKENSLGAALGISDNEEFFDAEEDVSGGVIILDDREEFENSQIKLFEEEMEEIVSLTPSPSISEEELEPKSPKDLTNERSTPDVAIQNAVFKESTADAKNYTTGNLYPLPFNKKVIRRTDIPSSISYPPSLLSFFRKNVGKDLTSLTMPVTSNEPTSILQFLSEMFEYSTLLNRASEATSPSESLKFVTAFAISALSIQRDKTRCLRKPFNPLLGETFELVREDLGFRLISEKVSHKPPKFAIHAEHELWECSYTVSPIQQFWGKSIELNNVGTVHVKLKKTGESFKWVQPTTMLKNLIAGERYIEPINEFEIKSSKGAKADIVFLKTGMFAGRSENLTVSITGKGKTRHLVGSWTDSIIDRESKELIWKVGELVSNSKQKYGFTKFTASLNAVTEIEADRLPPTDSRLRPDIKAYENGKIEKAEELKLQLEQMQRDRRANGKDVTPMFFQEISAHEWAIIKGPANYWEMRKNKTWNTDIKLW